MTNYNYLKWAKILGLELKTYTFTNRWCYGDKKFFTASYMIFILIIKQLPTPKVDSVCVCAFASIGT